MAAELPHGQNEKSGDRATALVDGATRHGPTPPPEVVVTDPGGGSHEQGPDGPSGTEDPSPNPHGPHGLRARPMPPPHPFSHWQSDLSARWVEEPSENWYYRTWEWIDTHIAKLGAATRRNPIYHHLWTWLQEGLVDRRMWKNWVRVMLIMFVSSLMMVIQPAIAHIGNATFFVLVSSILFPAYSPPMIHFIGICIMGLGGLTTWAWGCAAFASALSAQSGSRFRRQMAEFEASLKPGEDREAAFTTAVYDAKFLDPARSAIFAVFLFLGVYFLGWIRVSRPKLAPFFMAGCIQIDVMMSFCVLWPVKNYMIGKTLLKPLAVMFGISLVLTCLIFPQSLNNLCMDLLTNKALKRIRGIIHLQEELLHTSPNDPKFKELVEKVKQLRQGFIETISALEGNGSMLQLEVSYGKTSPGQVAALIKEVKELGERTFALGSLTKMIQEDHLHFQAWKDQDLPPRMKDRERRIEEAAKRLEMSGKSLHDLLPGFTAATAEIRVAVRESLAHAADFLNMLNHTRWPWSKVPSNFPPPSHRHKALAHLKRILEDFKSNKPDIVEPFHDMFDENGHLLRTDRTQTALSVRSLFRCCAFTSSIVALTMQLITFMELLIEIEGKHPKSKLQIPPKFFKAIGQNLSDDGVETSSDSFKAQNDLFDRSKEHPTLSDEEDDSGVVEKEIENEEAGLIRAQSRNLVTKKSKTKKPRKNRAHAWIAKHMQVDWGIDPDAGPPKNVFQRFCRVLRKLWSHFISPEGIFALRMGLLAVIIFIVAVAPHSARFFYHNRGLWALIMSQIALNMEAGQQLLVIAQRTTGVALGMATGIAIWYAGNGGGKGSPYGYPAVMLTFVAPLILIRPMAPKWCATFWMLWPLTACFVTGYSWDDNHLKSTASQGSGAVTAARRGLLVLIGLGCSSIADFVPPITSRKLVREGLSRNTSTLADLYALELAGFELGRKEVDDPESNDARHKEYRRAFFQAFQRLQAIHGRSMYTRLEVDFMGPWPRDVYVNMIRAQGQMLAYSSIMANVFMQLSPEWCTLLTDYSSIFNPRFTADVFALFSLVRNSLRTGAPMPPVLPIFERLEYHRSSQAAYEAARRWRKKRLEQHMRRRHRHHHHHHHHHHHLHHHDETQLQVPGPGEATPASALERRLRQRLQAETTSSRASGSPPVSTPLSPNSILSSGTSAFSSAQSSPESQSHTSTLAPEQLEEMDDDLNEAERADKALLDSLDNILTWKNLQDEQFAVVATALVAQIQFIAALDSIHRHVLMLVGSKDVAAFDIRQERWDSARRQV